MTDPRMEFMVHPKTGPEPDLLLVAVQRLLKLVESGLRVAHGRHSVAAKVMGRMLQLTTSFTELADGSLDVRMRLRRRSGIRVTGSSDGSQSHEGDPGSESKHLFFHREYL